MTISVLLNVLNGAETLKECLDSIAPLADELVTVIDSRTTDDTGQIIYQFLSEHPAIKSRVESFTWVDSFSEARNFALSLCTGDWIFQIDHDETLDPKSVPVIKDVVMNQQATGIAISILSAKGKGTAWNPAVRLFRNGIAHYVRRKHNIPILEPNHLGFFPHIVIHHSGYDLSEEEMAKKYERDEKLILLELQDNPLSVFAYRSLVRTYRAQRNHAKTIETAEKLYAMAEENGIEISRSTQQMVSLDLLETYMLLQDYDQAEEIGKKLLADYPGNIDAYFDMGLLYLDQERYAESIEMYQKYLGETTRHKLQPTNNQLIIEHWGSEHAALNNMAWAYSKMGRHKQAARLLQRAVGYKPESMPIRAAWQFELGNISQGDPLNILFVQNMTSSRNRKLAAALRAKGHRVTLAYTQENRFGSDDAYDEIVHIKAEPELLELAPNYDLAHCMDTPGYFAARLEEYTKCIVIRDIHDLSEIQSKMLFHWTVSGFSARHAHGLTFSTPQQLYAMNQMHGLELGKCMYIMNLASKAEKCETSLPKLSATDNQFHIVYEGYIGTESHIDMRDIFVELAEAGARVHVYPAVECEAYKDLHEHIHYHHRIEPGSLVYEMTQYDAGIVPWNLEKGSKEYLDSTIANKVFDYVNAGLPVITCNSTALAWYVREKEIGIVYDTVEDILTARERLREIGKGISEKAEYMEDHVDELIGFYRTILWQNRQPYQAGIGLTAKNIISLEEENLDLVWDAYFSEDGKYTKERIDKIVGLARGRVLDIGCSDGLIPILCARRGLRATGLDISPVHIMHCMEKLESEKGEAKRRLEFVRGDIETHKFDHQFDTIVMGQVLEHVISPDLAIEKALDVLAPGGRLLATVPDGFLLDPKHLRYFDERRFKSLMEQHCSVISIEHVGPRMLAICQPEGVIDNV